MIQNYNITDSIINSYEDNKNNKNWTEEITNIVCINNNITQHFKDISNDSYYFCDNLIIFLENEDDVWFNKIDNEIIHIKKLIQEIKYSIFKNNTTRIDVLLYKRIPSK